MAKQPLSVRYVRPLTAAYVGQRAFPYFHPYDCSVDEPTSCSALRRARAVCVASFIYLHPENMLRLASVPAPGEEHFASAPPAAQSAAPSVREDAGSVSYGDIQCCSMWDTRSR